MLHQLNSMFCIRFVCCRKTLGWGRQHQGRSCQDAERVREPEGLNQGGAAVNRDQSVHNPVMTSWNLNSFSFYRVIQSVVLIVFNQLYHLTLKNDSALLLHDSWFTFCSFCCFFFFTLWFVCLVMYLKPQINSKFFKHSKFQPHPFNEASSLLFFWKSSSRDMECFDSAELTLNRQCVSKPIIVKSLFVSELGQSNNSNRKARHSCCFSLFLSVLVSLILINKHTHTL